MSFQVDPIISLFLLLQHIEKRHFGVVESQRSLFSISCVQCGVIYQKANIRSAPSNMLTWFHVQQRHWVRICSNILIFERSILQQNREDFNQNKAAAVVCVSKARTLFKTMFFRWLPHVLWLFYQRCFLSLCSRKLSSFYLNNWKDIIAKKAKELWIPRRSQSEHPTRVDFSLPVGQPAPVPSDNIPSPQQQRSLKYSYHDISSVYTPPAETSKCQVDTRGYN